MTKSFHTESKLNYFLRCEYVHCSVSCFFCVKLFPHWEQTKGFIPVWVNMWFLRLPLREKDFPQWEQAKGFSGVWVAKWSLRHPLYVKFFPHWEQTKGFIPAWINMWIFRLPLEVKVFLHWVQLKEFIPVWINMCILKAFLFWRKGVSTSGQGERLYSSMN